MAKFSPSYYVDQHLSFESSTTFKNLWDIYRKNNFYGCCQNKLFEFHLQCDHLQYKDYYDKPLPNQASTEYTYCDIDSLLPFQKGLDNTTENFKYRRENILLFTEVYSKAFFTNQANPHQSFESKYNYETAQYADIFTLDCGIDILVTGVHAKLLLIEEFSPYFKRNTLLPHLNDIISSLTRTVVARKSQEQLEELFQSIHNYLLNFFVRLNSEQTHPKPPNRHGISIKTGSNNTFSFNPESSFLDLFHTLPFERTIYEHNSVHGFLKDKKDVTRILVAHYDKLQCDAEEKAHRERKKSEVCPKLWKNANLTCGRANRIHCDQVHYETHYERGRNFVPRSLAFMSAVKVRKIVQDHLFTPYPVQSDFLPIFLSAQQYFKDRFVPVFDYLLTNLCERYQKKSKFTNYFETARTFQKSDDFIRSIELTGESHCNIFRLQVDDHDTTLNEDWKYRCYFLVPTNKFPNVHEPYKYQDFTPLNLHPCQRGFLGKVPTPLDNVQITGRLREMKFNGWSDDSDDHCAHVPFGNDGSFSDSDTDFDQAPTDDDENDDDGNDDDDNNDDGDVVNDGHAQENDGNFFW